MPLDLPSALAKELPGRPVALASLAWPEIAAMRETGQTTLLLPVGATEQHGPHLPCDTDTVIAEAVCAVASALTGTPVLPALSYGVSLGHTEKWPGTFSVFHETLIAAVREIAGWAAATGFTRLLLVNGHCGNDAALRVAVDRIRFDFAGEFFAAVRHTYSLTPSIAAAFTADAADWHANRAETELMLVLAPDRVHLDRLASSDDPDRTGSCVFPHLVAHTSTNGVTGAPSTADPSRGLPLLREMGEVLAEIVTRVRTESPPLGWVRTRTAFIHHSPAHVTTNHPDIP
jgi:creatinine amidohydrolase